MHAAEAQMQDNGELKTGGRMARKSAKPKSTDLGLIERIKTAAIIAFFSDDDLMELLVLKGGNALDVVHRISTRSSFDLDWSLERDFQTFTLDEIRQKIERALVTTFSSEGFHVFDVIIKEQPKVLSPGLKSFWGGYEGSFKLIELNRAETLGYELGALQRQALSIGGRGKFEFDISKHEYTADKQEHDLRGTKIYVYSPAMLVAEKLRAICQQMPVYAATVSKHQAARARDFVDIVQLVEIFSIDVAAEVNRELLRKMFLAKRVPLALLSEIRNTRGFHAQDFESVKQTVASGVSLKGFDHYFDSVCALVARLEPFGDE